MQAAAGETITVSAEAPVVVHKTDSSTNILPEQIADLPVQDRDFQRLAFLAPGVQRERGGFRFINGGPVLGAGGARARFSQDAVREFNAALPAREFQLGLRWMV
jgi:hypothetical protein